MRAFTVGLCLLLCTASCGNSAEVSALVDSGNPPPIEFSCAGGCETAPAMGEQTLTEEDYYQLVQQVAGEPVGTASLALETLLFHSEATEHYLNEIGAPALTEAQEDFLRNEIGKNHVKVAFRVVDEQGVVSASLAQTTIPLGEKQHVHLETTNDLGALEAGGTVRRVGLHHVWSRW